jgi:anthranilate phosphoribosyltransferase
VVFRGEEGLDELSTLGPSRFWTIGGGVSGDAIFDPTSVGLATATMADLRGGDADFNAQVVRDLLAGRKGPVRDAVLLNAAAALTAAQGIGAEDAGNPDRSWLHARLTAGLVEAAEAIDSGAAAQTLDRWVKASQS